MLNLKLMKLLLDINNNLNIYYIYIFIYIYIYICICIYIYYIFLLSFLPNIKILIICYLSDISVKPIILALKCLESVESKSLGVDFKDDINILLLENINDPGNYYCSVSRGYIKHILCYCKVTI